MLKDVFSSITQRLRPADRVARAVVRVLSTGNARLRWICYGCAFLTGLIFLLSIFPKNLLLSGVIPNAQLNGDVAAHVVGQRAFLQDAWHWPLLKTTQLNAPEGLSIAMTDSNPLVALPLKLFRAWLPTGFSAVLFWLAFAYLMQAPAAVFALRSAGETRFIPAIAVSLFAIALPTFIYRHPHSALSAHFLLLLSLGSYFRTTRNLRFCVWLPPVLVLTSLLVHPYLAFMTLGIVSAAPLSLALRGNRYWVRAAIVVAASILLMVLVASCLGYAATDPPGGFGVVSMNAVSPFYPAFSHYLGRGRLFVDATGSQYEGYQYLGTGLLVLMAICFVTVVFSTRVFFLRLHLGLGLACLVLTALALSNVVYIGTHKVLDLEPVPAFMHQLRASGRVFWPVAYVIMVGCVATASRLLPGQMGSAVLLITAVLQLLDSRDLRRQAARDLRARAPMVLDGARLDALMATHRTLTILPAFGCGADANAPEFMELLLAASMHRVPANTMYVGRFGTLPKCVTTESAERPLAEGELRVFLGSSAHTVAVLVPGGADHCRAMNVITVCSLQPKALQGLAPVAIPSIGIGQDIVIGALGAPPILGPGWYTPEPNGAWTIESEAAIVTSFTPAPAGGLVLEAVMQGFTGLRGSFQPITVSVNGHAPTSFNVPDRQDYVLRLTIPQDQLVPGAQTLRFHIGHPARPSDLHLAGDTRQLGVFLKTIRFDLAPHG